jgi:hypothetical protein
VTAYVDVAVGEFFRARGGSAKFIRDYLDSHPGPYPVYSASLLRPFGHVAEYEYVGTYLTWVMNGYGGRVQEVAGRFAATRDRGVFVPLAGVPTPDLTYLRFALEPQLVAAAVGRRVDGRLNEYTKIYPDTAERALMRLPVDEAGKYDYERMTAIGDRLRRIESAQRGVRLARGSLERATYVLDVEGPSEALSLGDSTSFSLAIGERVLRNQHSATGVPVYSANVIVPFGHVEASNLTEFDRPSLLWGIDGVFDWNLIEAGEEFATTDHCGRVQVLNKNLDPEYVFAYLKCTRNRYGFDRVFRASLRNMKANVTVTVPLDSAGRTSLERQRALVEEFKMRERAQTASLAALADVLTARLTVEL